MMLEQVAVEVVQSGKNGGPRNLAGCGAVRFPWIGRRVVLLPYVQ